MTEARVPSVPSVPFVHYAHTPYLSQTLTVLRCLPQAMASR